MYCWIDAAKEAGCAALFFVGLAIVVVVGSWILDKFGGNVK